MDILEQRKVAEMLFSKIGELTSDGVGVTRQSYGSGESAAADFLRATFTTADGWIMIVIGNAIGLLLAILAFSISVVSFPLIIDRHVDAPTAIRTSIAAVEANPRVMMYWGLMVTGLLVLGCLPMLVGLIVVMPVLGHATWHLYRKVVG